jgi:hypothetical protein
MPGSVNLYGKDFDANFLEGRLIGISAADKQILTGSKIKSFLRIEDKQYNFKTTSSFSFEEKNIRGLRETLILEKDITHKANLKANLESSSLDLDYFFSIDFPLLFVTAKIKYPKINKSIILKQIIPIELPIIKFSKEDKIRIYSILSDGSRYEVDFTNSTSIKTLTGSLFYIKKNQHVFFFGFPIKHNIGVVQFKVEKQKKEYILNASFFGSYYQPDTQFYYGIGEIFSIYFGINDTSEMQIPQIPPNILKEIPEHTIFRI